MIRPFHFLVDDHWQVQKDSPVALIFGRNGETYTGKLRLSMRRLNECAGFPVIGQGLPEGIVTVRQIYDAQFFLGSKVLVFVSFGKASGISLSLILQVQTGFEH